MAEIISARFTASQVERLERLASARTAGRGRILRHLVSLLSVPAETPAEKLTRLG
jgi:hypothetical protein